MNENEFRELSKHYSLAAEVLLKEKLYTASSHLAGIAAECLLKSKISSLTKPKSFPPKNARDYYSHDINQLLKLLELTNEAKKEYENKSPTGRNIQTVRGWQVEDRYNIGVEEEEAKTMFEAVNDKTEGFKSWLEEK